MALPPTGYGLPAPIPSIQRLKMDVGVRYPEITIIKIIALICMIMAIVILLFITRASKSIILIGVVSGVAGLFGLLSLTRIVGSKQVQSLFMIISPGLLILAAMLMGFEVSFNKVKILLSSFSTLMEYIVLPFVFGISFLLYIEFMHGVKRWSEIGEMAIERDLKDFDFRHVLTNYIVSVFIYLLIIIVLSFVIVMIYVSSVYLFSPQFGESVEYNSVYGLAIISAIVFGLIASIIVIVGMIYSLVRGQKKPTIQPTSITRTTR